ncbi:hypothetical protein ES705_31982 [subsurface metagenome]
MEESRKKPVMIGVIVVCIIITGLITFARRGGGSGGIDGIPDDEMTWVKCSNPSCKAEYEMSKQRYHKEVQERYNRMVQTTPLLTCKQCSKDSLFRAVKCANPSCGIVFIEGIEGRKNPPDRCPDCGKSETEEIRKKRMAGG